MPSKSTCTQCKTRTYALSTLTRSQELFQLKIIVMVFEISQKNSSKKAEFCMTRLSGRTFGKGKLKIEYGSLSKKPVYDKNSRKVRFNLRNLRFIDNPPIYR